MIYLLSLMSLCTINRCFWTKDWCFWTVVLEKTLDNPLDCKEIKPVSPKGNKFWIFIGKTDAETPILHPPWCEELNYWKRPWCWERLKTGGEGDDRWGDGWMASLTQWIWVWVNSGSWWWTGRPGCAAVDAVAKSLTQLSNWTELNWGYTACCWQEFCPKQGQRLTETHCQLFAICIERNSETPIHM